MSPHTQTSHTQTSTARGGVRALGALIAAAWMVWCCAGPLIVAGAGLAVTGGALRNAWLVTVGTVIVLTGAGHALRRRGLTGPDGCCPNADVAPAERARRD